MKRTASKWSVVTVCLVAAGTLAQAMGSSRDSKGMDMSACQEMMAGGSTDKQGPRRMGKDHMPKECEQMMLRHGMDMSGSTMAQAGEHQGSGKVKSIDPAAGRVTLEHGEKQGFRPSRHQYQVGEREFGADATCGWRSTSSEASAIP